MVEADGPDALSMRKLAAELGVAPTAIYWHVGSREQLIGAMVDHAAQQQPVAVRGRLPRRRVLDATLAIWRTTLARPRLTALAHRNGLASRLHQPLEVALARELLAAGLDDAQAREALWALLDTLAGFLAAALRATDAVAQRASLWPDDLAPLAAPVDLEALITRTLTAIITTYIPEPASPLGSSLKPTQVDPTLVTQKENP